VCVIERVRVGVDEGVCVPYACGGVVKRESQVCSVCYVCVFCLRVLSVSFFLTCLLSLSLHMLCPRTSLAVLLNFGGYVCAHLLYV
jgi:hypothetical protein